MQACDSGEEKRNKFSHAANYLTSSESRANGATSGGEFVSFERGREVLLMQSPSPNLEEHVNLFLWSMHVYVGS